MRPPTHPPIRKGRLRLAVLIGSAHNGRSGPMVGRWFVGQARQRGDLDVDAVDLPAAGLPPGIPERTPDGGYLCDEVAAYAARMAAADAYVVITPEYNRGYPAPLKHAIDALYTEWRAKPVGFVSHGGQSGGLRAVEQLRQVFAELHTVTVRDSVSFAHVREVFDESGAPRDAVGANGAAKLMLDELTWWAGVLAEGRARRPYDF
ncbi:NADPH-dependent FMN reductase [Streptomyces gobiensis]|uniref:NADPH-dependent FMN reductase n=1 Tax=Streptomyces gobiensis TaxID=2875706 RepID=UPI001E4D2373|nr:NAD(P)H-dependent oxidoreductase [Streptomyces gobiensis]UGY93017.1 NAD(P)H-dependent oxidoreductase [Streptomyces gobiensis]